MRLLGLIRVLWPLKWCRRCGVQIIHLYFIKLATDFRILCLAGQRYVVQMPLNLDNHRS